MSGLDDVVVIIGAGHAGGAVAATLRQYGWAGPITLVGDERLAPYQRPPLSKAWLKGEAGEEDLLLRPAGYYEEHGIDLRLGLGVDRVDREARAVHTASGAMRYDRLIFATGARARVLAAPGADLANVLTLRTADDAERLKELLGPGRRVAVVGGGYVGLEVAASARALGAEAVVIEREPRLLARVACATLSDFFLTYHQANGVSFELGAQVAGFVGAEAVEGVALQDGRTVKCDVALVGVGAVPNEEVASRSGLTCRDGIIVDDAARTSDPLIYAIGDCSRRPLPIYDSAGRLESVPSALEQAKQAAADICGREPPAGEVPWFWSDQFDLKLQIAGLPIHAARTVIRGTPESGRFAVFQLDSDDRVQCVEAVNSPVEFVVGRQLVGSRKAVSPDRLRDTNIPMKSVA